ncbi:aldolase catalytic domain-containing protein [Succinivibrio dextrinosolvens]|uniref:aldolase catalytic domain-containing protein n=1 Tax=Succinivibrio dextrinosolvens TaxID=83771 RepID=UPI0019204640|nr:aldolase catalytic domain-containing protein [Succinivibrio dextrinosolvens]
MKKIQLLDCTLRDGGYVNDWRFGCANIVSMFERLVDANVDIIEVGFLDERRPFDRDRTIFPDTKSVDKLYGSLDKKNSMIVGMIDFGTCSINNLMPCENSYLDGIRVIFKKGKMYPAMEFCRQVKALGYMVFSQLVSVTSYSDDELLELIKLVNDVKPYAVSMVDTYGLLDGDKLNHIYNILDDNVSLDIGIGFHAHNNFQLGYSNVLDFLKYQGRHDIVVDGTLYGMGKSAGNDPIELVAMTLNEKYCGNYNIDSMLECINESVMNFYHDKPWGYNTFFYLCAKNKCHPNYLLDYEKEENLSVSMIDELLSTIGPKDKKLLYDKLVAKNCYESFLEKKIDEDKSINDFLSFIGNRKILLVGPGKNIGLQSQKVKKFIKDNDTVVISINYLPNVVDSECVFITNPNRYHGMTLDLRLDKYRNIKTLVTSNVTPRNGCFDFVINRAPLLEKNEKIIDNSFLMLINFLNKIGIKSIFCAGFDGYSEREDNYHIPEMEYDFVKREAHNLNSHIRFAISEYRKRMDITFITYSAYDFEEDIQSASI